MEERLFDPNLVYPSDEMGEYIELVGEITEMGGPFWHFVSVTVRAKKGVFKGFWDTRSGHSPKVGQWARIRIYNSGGGFYPDDRIVGFGNEEFLAAQEEEGEKTIPVGSYWHKGLKRYVPPSDPAWSPDCYFAISGDQEGAAKLAKGWINASVELDAKKMAEDPRAQVVAAHSVEFVQNIDRMTFGEALSCLKAGKRVCRSSGEWLNGEYVFLGKMASYALEAGTVELAAEATAKAETFVQADVLSCLFMRTAGGFLMPGWVPSQADMLAKDWKVYDG